MQSSVALLAMTKKLSADLATAAVHVIIEKGLYAQPQYTQALRSGLVNRQTYTSDLCAGTVKP